MGIVPVNAYPVFMHIGSSRDLAESGWEANPTDVILFSLQSAFTAISEQY